MLTELINWIWQNEYQLLMVLKSIICRVQKARWTIKPSINLNTIVTLDCRRQMSLHFNTFGLNEPDSQRLHPSSSTALKQQTFVLTSGEKARNGATGFVAERASSATPVHRPTCYLNIVNSTALRMLLLLYIVFYNSLYIILWTIDQ